MTHESLVGPKSLCKKPWLPAPRITAFSNHRLVSSPAISHDFPRFPGISHDFPAPPRGVQIECQRTVIRSRSASEKNSAENPLAHPAGLAGCFESFGSLAGHRDRASLVAELRGGCGKIPSLHFSPRGEAKCVRGPSGRGASRLARAGVLEQYVEHGKQTQRSPGGRMACFDRRVVRNAGWLLACISHPVLRPAVGEKCRVRPL